MAMTCVNGCRECDGCMECQSEHDREGPEQEMYVDWEEIVSTKQ